MLSVWFFPAARCVEFREPRSTENCKSKKCRDFTHYMLLFQGFDFEVLINLLDSSGLGFANELQSCVPESRLICGALSGGLAELARSNTLKTVAQIFT